MSHSNGTYMYSEVGVCLSVCVVYEGMLGYAWVQLGCNAM